METKKRLLIIGMIGIIILSLLIGGGIFFALQNKTFNGNYLADIWFPSGEYAAYCFKVKCVQKGDTVTITPIGTIILPDGSILHPMIFKLSETDGKKVLTDEKGNSLTLQGNKAMKGILAFPNGMTVMFDAYKLKKVYGLPKIGGLIAKLAKKIKVVPKVGEPISNVVMKIATKVGGFPYLDGVYMYQITGTGNYGMFVGTIEIKDGIITFDGNDAMSLKITKTSKSIVTLGTIKAYALELTDGTFTYYFFTSGNGQIIGGIYYMNYENYVIVMFKIQ